MAINTGYLTANRGKSGDEMYTPYYAVEPLLKYIPKELTIWCPFDEEWSAFYNTFKDNGYNVIRSSIAEGQDFFEYEPQEHYDIIISNPPFSMKDQVLKRCVELGKKFCLLLPLNSLQGIGRYKDCFKYGVELLAFDKRVSFHSSEDFHNVAVGSPFASAYFIGGGSLLPNGLIVEELNTYDKPLKQ